MSWRDRALTWVAHTHGSRLNRLGPGSASLLWLTDHVVGGVVRGECVLVRQRRQHDVPPLQDVLVLVGFAQLHALGDPFVAEFLHEIDE